MFPSLIVTSKTEFLDIAYDLVEELKFPSLIVTSKTGCVASTIPELGGQSFHPS